MPRKIYDIKPPKLVHKTEIKIKRKPVTPRTTQTSHVERKKAVPAGRQEKRSLKLPVVIGVLAVVIIIGTYLFFKLPKASITIWPKVDTLSFQKTIIADKTAVAVDTVKNVIPAQSFQVSKTSSQDFPATGNASNIGMASGTIIIYNKFDPPTSFTFKAGTHFMSDSGKLFVALQKIVVPTAKKSGSKITPGSVQVQVQAVEGGTDYNIAPSNFSIPGLKGTADYYSVYATSSAAMTGGYTGKVKKVTDDDIQGAKNVLTDKTTSDAMSAIRKQIPSDYVLLNNAALSSVASAATATKPGTVADNFNYKVTVTASALAFKKSDIDQFAKDFILSQLPPAKTVLDSSFKSDYSASLVDISGGKATVNINFSSGIYQNVDKNSLTLSLFGENANQINETVNSVLANQVSKIKINFWPFWVRSAPNSQKAVTVELKFQ